MHAKRVIEDDIAPGDLLRPVIRSPLARDVGVELDAVRRAIIWADSDCQIRVRKRLPHKVGGNDWREEVGGDVDAARSENISSSMRMQLTDSTMLL